MVEHPAASRVPGLTPKRYRDGTHRLIDPDQTVTALRPHLEALGITRVANVTGLDRIGGPVVMVTRPNSCSLAVHQGKGLTLAAARASGLMEAVEACHGERVALRRKAATYSALRRTGAVVDVARLPRRAWANINERAIPWVTGQDLLSGQPVWVPYELVHTRYTVPRAAWSGCFQASSNGLASGNCRLEAISHGICEVIERDATGRWLDLPREAQDRTRVDLATVDDAGCRAVLERFAAADIAVAVWEMTSQNRVPVYACQIQEPDAGPLRRVAAAWGHGCHPTRGIALSRALTEAAQSRLTWIAGSRDDCTRTLYIDSLARAEVERQRSYLEVRGAMRSFAEAPTFEAATFEEDVAWLLERLAAAGIDQVAVVDLTLRRFAISVVRVIVPGLKRHRPVDDRVLVGPRRALQPARTNTRASTSRRTSTGSSRRPRSRLVRRSASLVDHRSK